MVDTVRTWDELRDRLAMGLPAPAGQTVALAQWGRDLVTTLEAGGGATGPAGPQGETGPAGADGTDGAQGVKGDTGDVGPAGADGSPLSVAAAWPVGSVFISVVATNPATLLGTGTWTAFAAGRMLVGLDAGQTEFDTVEETGGAKTHTHAGHSAHNFTQPAAHSDHAAQAHSAHAGAAVAAHAALATHAHELPFHKVAGATGALRMLASSVFGTGTSRAVESVSAAPTSLTTSSAVELSQAVSAGTPDAHQVTQPSAHTDHAALSHSAHSGGAVDAHSAHDSPSSLPPFVTVFMWKRTA